MKKVFMSLLALFLAVYSVGCSNLITNKTAEKEETEKLITQVRDSNLIILDIYHNQCESCKLIEPVIEKLKEKYSQNKDIAFLKYDLSNIFTLLKSRQIAKELGLENIYKSQKFSGVVLLIDTTNKQVLDTLIGEYNLDKYIEVIGNRLHET